VWRCVALLCVTWYSAGSGWLFKHGAVQHGKG
jgi:hypothetical protein